MSSPTSFRLPFVLPESVPPEVQQAIRYAFSGLKDVNDAIGALVPKVNAHGQSITTINQTIQQTVSAGGGGTGSTSIGTVNQQIASGGAGYDMLAWMTMDPTRRGIYHLEGTKLDNVTPGNHIYTQVNAGDFYWIKGDSGFPWDIQIIDNDLIYLSTTENGYASATTGKRFESLNPAIGFKGVPFAKRFMNIGDSVLSADSRLAIYTACGVATYTNIGKVKCTLAGPFVETIPGAGGNLPANLTTLHLQYEWSLDGSYNHQAGSTMETYTLCQPYGLINWITQPWNTGTLSYDPPTDGTHFNILTVGVTGLPASDPCPYGINVTPSGPTGSGDYTLQQSDFGALVILESGTTFALSLNSLITAPFYAVIENNSLGVATLTPTTGLVNNSASWTIPSGQFALAYFDGNNWWTTQVFAQTFTVVPHEWIDSFNATTGVFHASQPRASDMVDSTVGSGPIVLDSGATVVNETLTGITKILGLLVFANNAAAVAGGLAVGTLYRTGADPDFVAVVH